MSLEFWSLRPQEHEQMLAIMLALDFTRDINRNAEHASTLIPQTMVPVYVKVNNR